MNDFRFVRPSSLAEAVAALRNADDGKFLSGGQSLLPVMKLNLAQPTALIALSHLSELKGVHLDGGTLTIGASTVHAEVASSPTVRNAIRALADLAGRIGDPQVRNRGTLGGSVAHNDPAADYPAACLALGATIETDRRRIGADDFFRGLFETALEEDEIVVAVHFPMPSRAAYAKFASPASKYAVVGVFVAVTPGGVRVAVTGAGSGVFRHPDMEAALGQRFAVDALAGIRLDPRGLNSDQDGSAEYRAHLVGVMARRAVAACA